MLNLVKIALRLSVDAYDDELKLYIESAKQDLELAGVVVDEDSEVIQMAIITYCRMRFGSPQNYEQLKRAYDEQKAQLQIRGGGYDERC